MTGPGAAEGAAAAGGGGPAVWHLGALRAGVALPVPGGPAVTRLLPEGGAPAPVVPVAQGLAGSRQPTAPCARARARARAGAGARDGRPVVGRPAPRRRRWVLPHPGARRRGRCCRGNVLKPQRFPGDGTPAPDRRLRRAATRCAGRGPTARRAIAPLPDLRCCGWFGRRRYVSRWPLRRRRERPLRRPRPRRERRCEPRPRNGRPGPCGRQSRPRARGRGTPPRPRRGGARRGS